MLTISLHQIRIHGPHGLYPEEAINGNNFEVDVDVRMPALAGEEWPFVDYSIIYKLVNEAFGKQTPLLESLVQQVHAAIIRQSPEAASVRVCVRKMHPPLEGDISYAQVCFDGAR